jgi:ribonuclease J
VITLDQKNPRQIDVVQAGRWGYDGNRMIPMINPILRERGRMAMSGAAFVTICLDKAGRLKSEPVFSLLGISEGHERTDIETALEKVVVQTLHNNPVRNAEESKEQLRVAVRRRLSSLINKKPTVEIHLVIG